MFLGRILNLFHFFLSQKDTDDDSEESDDEPQNKKAKVPVCPFLNQMYLLIFIINNVMVDNLSLTCLIRRYIQMLKLVKRVAVVIVQMMKIVLMRRRHLRYKR